MLTSLIGPVELNCWLFDTAAAVWARFRVAFFLRFGVVLGRFAFCSFVDVGGSGGFGIWDP